MVARLAWLGPALEDRVRPPTRLLQGPSLALDTTGFFRSQEALHQMRNCLCGQKPSVALITAPPPKHPAVPGLEKGAQGSGLGAWATWSEASELPPTGAP